MRRVRKSKSEWETEKDYILNACQESRVPGNFSDDPLIFRSYVAMQSRFVRLDGWGEMAYAMRIAFNNWRDKVCPDVPGFTPAETGEWDKL